MLANFTRLVATVGSGIYRANERWIDTWFKGSGLMNVREHAFYAPRIGPDAVVLDLGANRGDFSSALSEGFGCKCYAVEASVAMYNALPESPLCLKFNYAIARRDGDVAFYVSDNSEASSTNRQFADAWGMRERIIVRGITLETFLKNNSIETVDLLKCDIEGSETELFASMSDETVRRVKQFSIEFHDFIDAKYVADVVNIRKRLASLGFFSVTPTIPYSNANVLFIHKASCLIPRKTWLKLYIFKHVVLRSRCVREPVLRLLKKAAGFLGWSGDRTT